MHIQVRPHVTATPHFSTRGALLDSLVVVMLVENGLIHHPVLKQRMRLKMLHRPASHMTPHDASHTEDWTVLILSL